MEAQAHIPAVAEDEAPVRRGPGRPSRSNAELLDLSLDLFYDNGFERTSIDAICAAAGMAKRTVYARYGDKETLFKAALTRAIGKWIVPVERLHALESDDFERTLLDIGRVLVANVLSPAGLRLLRLTNAESVRMPEFSTFSVQRGTEPTLVYLADLFRRRLASDGVASADEIAQAFLSLVVGGVSNNAAWGMILPQDAVDRHIRYTLRIFLHGVRPVPGTSGDTPGIAALEEDNLRLKKLLAETMIQLDQARDRNP